MYVQQQTSQRVPLSESEQLQVQPVYITHVVRKRWRRLGPGPPPRRVRAHGPGIVQELRHRYATPRSGSILPSITNKMLMQLAADRGIDVQPRLISIDEIPSFQEVGACGTATVCVPIASITNGNEKLDFGIQWQSVLERCWWKSLISAVRHYCPF